MGTPRKPLDDGILVGRVPASNRQCNVCDAAVISLDLETITLPEGITPGVTLIVFGKWDNELRPIKFLGIGCGCYAKFHRQIAHIQGKMKK